MSKPHKQISNAHQQARTRERIKTGLLINRLHKQALGELKKPMDTNQIQAARLLLERTLPVLKAVEVSGELDHSVEFVIDLSEG